MTEAKKQAKVPKVKVKEAGSIALFLEDNGWVLPVGCLALAGALLGVLGKSTMRDVDSRIAVDLTQGQYDEARTILARKNNATLLDRNPGIMGFLTLGLSNFFTNGSNNVTETVFELRRNNADLVKNLDLFSANQHKKRVDLQDYHIQKRKSEGHESMTRSVVGGAVKAISVFSK